MELDPQETIRIVQMSSPIYNQVYDYAIPTDLKGNKIIDIRPQTNRTLSDLYVQGYNQDFDRTKSYTLQPNFTIQWNQGVKTMRIDNNLIVEGLLLNSADTINGNGTWSASGSASGLTQNNLRFAGGASSSLSFNLAASGSTGTLQNSTMQAQNLTNHYLQSHIFFYTYLPTASDFTSVEIRWGSSTTDYWSQTLTVNQQGNAFEDGWNLLDANWATATVVGSPSYTAVDTLTIIWTYNGTAQQRVCLNSIWSRLGELIQIEYYSKYLFTNAITGAFQQGITADTNIINLDTETRNLLYLLSGVFMTQQIQGLDGMFYDGPWFQNQYDRALADYKAQYKSQWQKPRTTYYQLPNPSNQNWSNSNRWNY